MSRGARADTDVTCMKRTESERHNVCMFLGMSMWTFVGLMEKL